MVEAREVSDVAPGDGNGGNGHTIHSRHCLNMDDMEFVARKRKDVCRHEAISSMH